MWEKNSTVRQKISRQTFFGHFLRGRSLKGRCNIRVYVPVCVCVCVFLFVSLPSPPTPAILWGRTAESPPTPPHDPSPPLPHPYLQAIARPTPGKNYPLKSARIFCILESEVSKRGWRTEGVGARKSLKGQRFRPLFCTFFPMPP